MSTSDLVERVRAAIESHIEIAQKATPGPWRVGPHLIRSEPLQVLADAAHVALQNPQDTLRRCEADLRTLDRHQPDRPLQPNVWQGCTTCRHGDIYDGYTSVRWPCPDFLDRASAYGVPVDPEGS